MGRICVFVSGVGGGAYGEQILKALKLAETDYIIVAGDMSPYSKGLFEVDFSYLLPPANDPEYIESLLAICNKHNVRAIFPGSEPELKVISKERKALTAENLFLPINPSNVILTCMDKIRMFEFLQNKGFDIPEFCKINSIDDLKSFDKYPAILKPSIGSGGSKNTFLAQDRDELLLCGRYLLKIYPEFIIQEYIGTPDSEYTVGVLTDMEGNLINSIAVKRYILSGLSNHLKVRSRTNGDNDEKILAISSGITQGEIGQFSEVTKPCEEVALALGARGTINIQCRLVDKKVCVFEINPRFSGTTSLRAMVGYNEPDVLIRKHVLDEEISPYFPYSSGVILRGISELLVDSVEFSKKSALED